MQERNIPGRSAEEQQVSGEALDHVEHQSRAPETTPGHRLPEPSGPAPLPSRDQLIDELSATERMRIQWPNIGIRVFSQEEEAQFRSWVAPLSDAELAQELSQRRAAQEAEIRQAAAEAGDEPPDIIFR